MSGNSEDASEGQYVMELEGVDDLVADRFNALMDGIAYPIVINGMFLIVKINDYSEEKIDSTVIIIDDKTTAGKYTLNMNPNWVKFSTTYQGIASGVERNNIGKTEEAFVEFRRNLEGYFISQMNKYKADIKHDVSGVTYNDNELSIAAARTPSTGTADSFSSKTLKDEGNKKVYGKRIRRTLKHNKIEANIIDGEEDELTILIPKFRRVIHVNCMHFSNSKPLKKVEDEPIRRGKNKDLKNLISNLFFIIEHNLIVCVCAGLGELLKSLKYILLKSPSSIQKELNQEEKGTLISNPEVVLQNDVVEDMKKIDDDNEVPEKNLKVKDNKEKNILVSQKKIINEGGNVCDEQGSIDVTKLEHISPIFRVHNEEKKDSKVGNINNDIKTRLFEGIKEKLKENYELKTAESTNDKPLEFTIIGFTGSMYKTEVDLMTSEQEERKEEKLEGFIVKITDSKNAIVPKPFKVTLKNVFIKEDEIVMKILKYTQKKVCPSNCFRGITPDRIYISLDSFFADLRKIGKIINYEIKIGEEMECVARDSKGKKSKKSTKTIPVLKFIVIINPLSDAPAITLYLKIKKMESEVFQSFIYGEIEGGLHPQASEYSTQVIGTFTSYALYAISFNNIVDAIQYRLPYILMFNDIHVASFIRSMPSGPEDDDAETKDQLSEGNEGNRVKPNILCKLTVVDKKCEGKKHQINVNIGEGESEIKILVNREQTKKFSLSSNNIPAVVLDISKYISDTIRAVD